MLSGIKGYMSSALSKLRKTRQSEQYFFMHIPKTAGTSLRTVIESQFSPSEINEGYRMEDFFNLTREQLLKLRLIRGHLVYGIVNYLPRHPITITMLREPISRAISNLYVGKRRSSFHLNKHLPIDKMTLDEMLQEKLVRDTIGSQQVRYFITDIDITDPKNPRKVYPTGQISDRERLELAKERVASFDFVGITEEFDRSVKLLIKRFGWKEPKTLPRLNATGDYTDFKRSLSDKGLEILKELTALDRELYDFACDLFRERYNKTFSGNYPNGQ
jgi:hypothetical protein